MSVQVAAGASTREVVIGASSKVWRTAARDAAVAARFTHAISHRDIDRFEFGRADRVWVFAYSRVPEENTRLFAALEGAGVREVVYISSASTIVSRITRCYEYPRVKQLAQEEARTRLGARVLMLGIVYEHESQLPGGLNAATSQQSINRFLLAPEWLDDAGSARHLFEPTRRPFSGSLEAALYRIYGALQSLTGSWPCILRPLDLLLRLIGVRWYGYIYLSNRLWYSTTS